jgi:sulfopyruvate decarboxylase TPP-binding subunit
VAGCLRDLGATHVVALPDNVSAPVLEALREDGGVRLVSGTREGEIIALASGLWVGGGSPVVIIQNTGLLESGDALRGTASRMGCPLLILVTCRGYETARAHGLEPREVEMNRETLVRPDLDSVAPMTEATLQAWGIPFLTLGDAADLSPIRAGWGRAHAEERPVAVLVDAHFS